jgi:surfeit locus 1 family protein
MTVPQNTVPDASVRPHRRFAPNVWLSVLALAVVALTVRLGMWQLARVDEKQALQSQWTAQQLSLPLQGLADVKLPRDRYRRVALDGRFDPRHSVLHDNQIHAQRAGLHSYVVFHPADGSVPVLVNQGWIAVPSDRRLIQATSIQVEPTIIHGRLNVPAARTKRLADGADTDLLAQTIDLAALSAKWKLALAPYVIEQTDPSTAYARAWPAPDFKIDTHRMYAGQWLLFGGLAAVLWLVLSFKKVSP